MILGIGTDLCNIDRIGNSLARYGERFENRVFTDIEIAKARRRPFTIYWPQDDLQAHVASALRMDPGQVTMEDLRILLGQVFPKANYFTRQISHDDCQYRSNDIPHEEHLELFTVWHPAVPASTSCKGVNLGNAVVIWKQSNGMPTK